MGKTMIVAIISKFLWAMGVRIGALRLSFCRVGGAEASGDSTYSSFSFKIWHSALKGAELQFMTDGKGVLIEDIYGLNETLFGKFSFNEIGYD